jgi:hypothetical protein
MHEFFLVNKLPLQRFAEVLTLREYREPQNLRQTRGSIFPRTAGVCWSFQKSNFGVQLSTSGWVRGGMGRTGRSGGDARSSSIGIDWIARKWSWSLYRVRSGMYWHRIGTYRMRMSREKSEDTTTHAIHREHSSLDISQLLLVKFLTLLLNR